MPVTSEQAQIELRRRAASAELERRKPVSKFAGAPAGMTYPYTPSIPDATDQKASFGKQMIGALSRGGMSVGQAVLEVPKHTMWLAGNIMELDPYGERRPPEEVMTGMIGETLTKKYLNLIKQHKQGQEAITKSHPEWEYEPSEHFLDLLTSPKKLSLAIAESTPMLIGAGIMTAAGRPDLSMAMIYTVEGQEAADQAITEGASEEDAAYVYHVYGGPAALIEQYLRINPAIKLGKGAYNKVLNRVAQKAVRSGKRITKETGLALVQEAIEEPLQGAWQEITAKSIYGKEIPGGVGGFIDRRAQEAYIGGVMGLLPIGAGGVAGITTRQMAGVPAVETEQITPEERKVPEPIINVYRGTETGKIYTDEAALKMKRVEGDTRLVDKETGEEVILDPQASQSAIVSKTAEEPVTSEQAIGQQYGLTNEQVTEQLSQAEQRYRELKRKDVPDRTAAEKRELAFLRRNKSNIEALLEQETQPEVPKIKRRSKTTLRAVGHKVTREAELTDGDYRELAEVVTGKRSMKDMSRKEMDEFVSALEESYGSPKELTKEDYEIPISVAGRGTTMSAVYRDAVETTDRLPTKQEIPDTVKMGFGKVGAVQRLKSFFFGIDNTPVYHLARILDGTEEGIFSEVLDKGIESGRKTTAAHTRSVHTELKANLEDAEVTDDNLAKMSRTLNPRTQTHQMLRQGAATEILTEKINDRDFEITWANLIDIYLISNQKDGMRHLTKGGLVINNVETGKLSEAQVLDLRQKVEDNPQAVTIADAILKIGRDVWKPSLNQVSNNLEGRDIATIQDWWGLEVYMPKRVAGKQRPGLARALDINLIENKSILRDRTRSTAPLIVRDAFNRFSIFENAIAEYVGMAEPTRTSRTLLNDPAIAKALERKGYGRIRNHILDIHKHAQSVPASEGSFTAFFARHLPGLYRAVLFFNPRVIASQYTSAFNYGAYVSPEFIDSIKDGLSIKNAQETLELSDIAWERFNMGHSSLELGEMAKSDASLRFWTGKASDINKLGWALKVADLGALTAGMSIAKQEYQAAQKGKLKGLSAEWWLEKDDLPDVDEAMVQRVKEEGENAIPEERQAVEVWKQLVSQRAEYLWQRTQPSWDKWNRSLLTTQKGVRRLFLLFRSFHEKSLTIFNEAKLDYENSPKAIDDKTRFVQRTGSVMIGYTVNMTLRLAILAAMTRKIKEPLAYLSDFMTGWMAMFPLFGRVLDSSLRSFIYGTVGRTPEYRGEPLESFPIKMINMVLKAPADFTAAAGYFVGGYTKKAETSIERGVKKITTGVGALYGVPVFEAKRVLPEGEEAPAPARRRIPAPPRRRPG